ncbi:MAG: MFS transporter [Gemmataceae bacterium]
MKPFQPADHLRSRTFLALLVAQFLAAFNDQAIHAAAMFFAINTDTLSEARAISLMPILFYAPWAIFCTIAGYCADRYSKRVALILWKIVEVGITLLALGGFWLGRQDGHEAQGAWVVLATVFLMGMHSAFFVPAKYGAMPEILTPRMLSRGNGVLESLSFLAVILGTVFGGALSFWFRGSEYMIGLILVGLAVIGALASLFLERIPTANPDRPFPRYIYQPLFNNIRLLFTSRPLVFAVVGIAFFTFLVAYMRAVVYMHGQSQLPPWDEARTSYIVGMVALGIGLGSPLVGYLSGGKVEVGLVPLGAIGMILATSVAAFTLHQVPVLVACIILIGFFTGFYLVPLFSLLQHRAPKTSKGDAIATSNFINISGAIAASLVFAAINWAAIRTGFTPSLPVEGPPVVGMLTADPEYHDGHPHRVVIDDETTFTANEKGPQYVFLKVDQGLAAGAIVAAQTFREGQVTYVRVQLADRPLEPIYNKQDLPALLFLSAGGMTFLVLGVLWWLLPDVFQRARVWLATRFHQHLEVAGLLRLPGHGPVVLVTDAPDARRARTVHTATDRVVHFLQTDDPAADPEETLVAGRRILKRGGIVGVRLDGTAAVSLLEGLQRDELAPMLPVHYGERTHNGRLEVYVIAGSLLAPATPTDLVREELDRLRHDLDHRLANHQPLEHSEPH